MRGAVNSITRCYQMTLDKLEEDQELELEMVWEEEHHMGPRHELTTK